MRKRQITATAVAIGAALVVAACGSSNSSSSAPAPGGSSSSSSSSRARAASGTINGAGSTFAAPIYMQWGSTLKGQGLTVNFNAVGSGAGVAQLQSATVDFAGSDPAMPPDEVKAAKGPVAQFPIGFGAITVSYNLSGVKSGIKLDGKTLGDIFLGKVKKWNDPEITALNPGLSLPSTCDHGRSPLRLVGHDEGVHHLPVGLQPDLDRRGRQARQDRQVADRHRRQGQLGRRRGGQADGRRDRIRRAGLRAAERLHVRVGQEQLRQVHRSDDRGGLRGGGGDQGPAGPDDLDDQLAQPGRVPDHVADVRDRLQGHVQGRDQPERRVRRQEVPGPTVSARGQAVEKQLFYAPLPASLLSKAQAQLKTLTCNGSPLQ